MISSMPSITGSRWTPRELVPALYQAVEARDLPGMADVDASLLAFCRYIKPHATGGPVRRMRR